MVQRGEVESLADKVFRTKRNDFDGNNATGTKEHRKVLDPTRRRNVTNRAFNGP